MSVLRLRGLQAGNLKNLDLDISQGQWTGIHGPSGAGKSALLFGVLEAVAKRRFQILHDPHALPSSNHEDFEGLADEVAGLQPVVAWEGEIPKRRAEVRLMEALQLEPLLVRETKLHGERKCSSCESIWQPKPFLELLDLADSWSEGERLEVGFEASGIPAETLLLGGLVRFHHEGKSLRLEDVEGDLLPGAYCTLDRFRWSQVKQLRLGDALSEADRRQRAVRIQLGAKEWVVPPSTECPQCGVVHSSVGLQEIFKSQDSYGWQLHQRDLLQWLEEPMEVWCDRFDLHDLEDVSRRLLGMVRTGLGHLHPARALGTLSLGESRRLELCAMLSQVRRNQLILFDEPGMGLHGRERKAVVQLLRELVEQGNTVLTADPAREFLEGADSWVRLGPGGGRLGGTLTGQGTRLELAPQAEGLVPPDRLRLGKPLTFKELTARHLDIQQLQIPTECVVAIAGVSGSGKTTLLEESILPRLRARDGFSGSLPVGGVKVLLERALGSAAMSTVATLAGAWSHLRRVFADGEEGRILGLTPADFVARPGQGACKACRGHGVDPLRLVCSTCEGLGLRSDLLQVRWRNRSLHTWLTTPVEELVSKLPHASQLRRLLDVLTRLGLGGRTLGERGRCLSLGERSRLALARELSAGRRDRPRIFLLDEPCLGLPTDEALRVVEVLRALAQEGHSFWVVEHHEVMLRCADEVIELGPGAGAEGGRVVFQGRPDELLEAATETGDWLRSRIEGGPPPPAPPAWKPLTSEILPEDLHRSGRRALEQDLAREFATRSPLTRDLFAMAPDPSELVALPPVAWPLDPPRQATLADVLGLTADIERAFAHFGESCCVGCGGKGPWPDLESHLAGHSQEMVFATPWTQGGEDDASGLLTAAGFRRLWRNHEKVLLTASAGLQKGDLVYLDEFTPTDGDASSRLRELEHHAQLFGNGLVHCMSAGDGVMVYQAGACRDCGVGSLESPAAMHVTLGGVSLGELQSGTLEEALKVLRCDAKEVLVFGSAQSLLAGSSLLAHAPNARWQSLNTLEQRAARLLGWLIHPLEGVVLLHDQPLAGMPPALARRWAKALSQRGCHRWTDAEGWAATKKSLPKTPHVFDLAFDLEDWVVPDWARAEESVAQALGLEWQLAEQFIATEGARLRGWTIADCLGARGLLRCGECKSADRRFHDALSVPCSACGNTGWVSETREMEIRGLSWLEWPHLTLHEIRVHFEGTPEIEEVATAAEAFGVSGWTLGEKIHRLPFGARMLLPLIRQLEAGDALSSMRLGCLFAGWTPLETQQIRSTIDGYLSTKEVLDLKEHHPGF